MHGDFRADLDGGPTSGIATASGCLRTVQSAIGLFTEFCEEHPDYVGAAVSYRQAFTGLEAALKVTPSETNDDESDQAFRFADSHDKLVAAVALVAGVQRALAETVETERRIAEAGREARFLDLTGLRQAEVNLSFCFGEGMIRLVPLMREFVEAIADLLERA